MLIFLIVFLCLIFAYLQMAKENSFYEDYLAPETTHCIEGVFVVLVFIRHFSQYLSLDASIDLPLKTFNGSSGQLIVVMFLFYTGYGTMLSIAKKGQTYVKRIFVHKFLKLFLHFDICVLFYLIFNLLTGRSYGLQQTLLAFTSWTSIGNSNWYITAILFFYLIVLLAFSLFHNKPLAGLITVTILSVALIYFLKYIGRPNYTFNTFLVLPLGMWYAHLRKKIDALLRSKPILYPLALCVSVTVMAYSFVHLSDRLLWYCMWALSFACVIILLSMKVRLRNPFFSFLGQHVFSIYILQRLPMMFFIQIGINAPIYMFLCSAAATILMALVFDRAMAALDKKLFVPRVSKTPEIRASMTHD